MKMPTITDGRGNESTTAVFVIPAVLLVMVKFALSGHFGFPVMSGTEFAAGFGSVMGIWTWREIGAKKNAT